MCMICVEFQAGQMTRSEAVRAVDEVYEQDEHTEELAEIIGDEDLLDYEARVGISRLA